MLPKIIDLTDFSASECSDIGFMSELCCVFLGEMWKTIFYYTLLLSVNVTKTSIVFNVSVTVKLNVSESFFYAFEIINLHVPISQFFNILTSN